MIYLVEFTCFDGDVKMTNSSAEKSKLELSSEVTLGSLIP